MPVDAQLILLDKDQVASLVTYDDVLEAVREAFILHATGEARLFPVVREHLATGGIFGIKSGDVQRWGLLGFKAAGFWPSNRGLGAEPHQATIILIDPNTGRPVCIIDGNAVTTMRSAAAGALGLSVLAQPNSSRLCVFGTGVQARAQLTLALRLMPSICRVRYVTRNGERDPGFEACPGGSCEISHARDCNAAVAESDVVITATPATNPLFDLAAVRAGTHFNCVGADTKGKRELPEGLLERALLFVDDRAQARQIGESQWASAKPCTELGELLSGCENFRRRAADITVFDLTGLALQDLTVARLLEVRAMARGIGSRIPWRW